MSGSTFRMGEGDWICGDSQCANINFARRTQCNRCGSEKSEALNKRKLGQEIGKAAAAKSHGLFSADDWQCNKCGNVNWARRQQCNVCNAPRFGDVEERTGLGGGYNDRGVVEYKQRDDSDDDYDEFGRRKKRLKKSDAGGEYGKTNGKRSPKQQEKEHEETDKEKKKKEDEEEEDEEDDEAEEADEDEEEDDDDDGDGDLSKYDLNWASETDDTSRININIQSGAGVMLKGNEEPLEYHMPKFKVNKGSTGKSLMETLTQRSFRLRHFVGAGVGLALVCIAFISATEELQYRRAERVARQVIESSRVLEDSESSGQLWQGS